jgi:ribosomal protein L37AE/L43A
MSSYKPTCKMCGDEFDARRFKLGYAVCLDCGEEIAHDKIFTVAPINKSNYMMITDMAMLKQLNPKRTT